MTNKEHVDVDSLADDIENSIRKAACVSSKKEIHRSEVAIELSNIPCKESLRNDALSEYNEWKDILNERDPKRV